MLTLPGFEIVQELYKSKSSHVFRARDKVRDQNVVLKVLGAGHASSGQVERFQREFEMTRYLGDQIEGVIQAYTLEELDQGWVMTLEDFGGISLTELMRGGQWHRSQFYRTAARIVEVLKAVHGEHIIHKDLNPSNILINPYTDELRIIDFGIASNLGDDTSIPAEKGMEGTLPYLAPEQTGRMHLEMDIRTDFYALGVTFYELVTGQLPFYSEDPGELVRLHTTREPQPPTVLDKAIPDDVSALILKMMAKNGEERHSDATALLAELEALPHVMPDEHSGFYGVQNKLSSLSFTTSPTTQTSHNLWGDMLDYTTVLKSSQAISSEIILENLVSRLMVVMLENAGAQRGVLVMQKEGEWVLEAEGESDDVTFLNEIPLNDPANATRLPCSLVEHVCREHAEVILEGPESYADWAVDPYFADHRPVSVLCLPILSKGKALGVVYLENNLVRGMFLREHFEVIRLLAAQAAIALENAMLMRSLQEREDELRRANTTLEQKVAERTEQLREANAVLERRVQESERAQRVLLELARYGPKSYTKRLRQLLQTCAKTLDVERVSHWRVGLDGTYASREDLYIRSTDAHFEESRRLSDEEFPDFMRELSNLEFLRIDNVAESERTRAIADSYFGPKGISSLLVVAVWRGGKVVGGLSLGHVGPSRVWSHTEVDFATAVGQLISLAMETDERRRVEQDLRLESDILKYNPNPILRFDPQGRVTYGNPEAHRLFPGLQGRLLESLVPDVSGFDLGNCIREDQVHRLGGEISGRYFQFEVRGNQDLGVGQIFGFDITDVHRAEEALRKSERELKAVFESSNDAILIADGKRFHNCNSQAVRMFGFRTRKDVMNSSPDEIWPAFQPDGRESLKVWNHNMGTASTNGYCRFDWLCQRLDNQTFPADILLSSMALEEQSLILVTIRDISMRVRAEEELRLSEERWHYAVEGSQDGIWDWHIANDEVYYSPRYKEILGYRDHELPNLQSTWEERVHPEDLERVNEEIRKTLMRENDTFQHTYRMIARDGSIRWILARGKAIYNEYGEPVRMSGSHTDITERNLAEARFRLLFEYSSDAHILYNENGIVDCNKATLREFGFKAKEEILGRQPHALSPERQPDGSLSSEKALTLEKRARSQGHYRFEWVFLRRDGGEVLAEVTLTPVLMDQCSGMLGVLHDITEHKRADRLQTAKNHILEMISTDTPSEEVMNALALDTQEQLRHCACAILIDSEAAGLKLLAAPRLADLTAVMSDGEPILDRRLLLPESSVVVEDLAEAPEYSPLAPLAGGFRGLWLEPIRADDERVQGSVIVFSKEAGEPSTQEREVLTVCARLGGIAIHRRLSEEEMRRARDTAQMADRAKTRFLSNMSHELRTPLNAIIGFSQLMARDPGLQAGHREHLDTILRSGEHLLTIINDVLEMSRIESGGLSINPENFDLYHLLTEVEGMFQTRMKGKGLYLHFRKTSEVPRYIRSDPGKIRQILINLLGNALKFTREGGVSVMLAASPEEGRDVSHRLQINVMDTGPGIAQAEQDKLFEAFAQTEYGRETQGGAGLGLAICRELVEFLGGEIGLESEIGKGSNFSFHIPVLEMEEKDVVSIQADHRVTGPGDNRDRRILVAGDTDRNRNLLPEEPDNDKPIAREAPAHMPELPEELVAEIEQATLLGDLGQLTDLVEKVRTIDESLADLMLDQLDHFAYDALIRLVRGASHDA
ncbi:MAG: PAS domain S-box protein [Acidobacteriota bacterium]|nr:PAS domain S-box protein [Acidobacteriota bacterium]